MFDFKKLSLEELAAKLNNLDELTQEIENELLSDDRKGAAELLKKYHSRKEKDKLEIDRIERMLVEERRLWKSGFGHLAGIDEAGRGPLAGPVVAAAVVLSPGCKLKGLNDSKLLSSARRTKLFEEIVVDAADYGIGSASHEEIDRLNIHQATFLAASRAIAKLRLTPDYILIDGFPLPNPPCCQKAIISGDRLSLSIAAASILAKVARDNYMKHISSLYPHYGFERNMGYATEDHRQALCKYGPCPIHRSSFRLEYLD